MVSPFWRIRKLWMVMTRSPLCRILEARLQPVAVGIEMGLRAVGENLERRQHRSFGLDDALHRRCAEFPVVCDAAMLSAAGCRRARRARSRGRPCRPSSRRSTCRGRPAIWPATRLVTARVTSRAMAWPGVNRVPRGVLVPKMPPSMPPMAAEPCRRRPAPRPAVRRAPSARRMRGVGGALLQLLVGRTRRRPRRRTCPSPGCCPGSWRAPPA